MEKSPDAFRTISEVADWLGVPTHVLRFWESRFSQVKPVKRAGGRRYYRPQDMMLLGGIKQLLHDDGMTIRGVQKMLREEGIRHVSSFSQPLDAAAPLVDVTPEDEVAPSPMAVDVEPEPLDNVVPIAAGPADLVEVEQTSAPERERETSLSIPELIDEDVLFANRTGGKAARETAPEPAALPEEPDEAPPEAAGPDNTAESPRAEEEALPELAFLRRAAAESDETPGESPIDAAPAEASADAQPQADLFATRRRDAAAPEPAPARIPETPDVPATDAPDDDPATPAFPGLAARLFVHPVRPDHAAIARAVADLRDLRARL
jgi:DNA-binding transcriptional MerR regulator